MMREKTLLMQSDSCHWTGVVRIEVMCSHSVMCEKKGRMMLVSFVIFDVSGARRERLPHFACGGRNMSHLPLALL